MAETDPWKGAYGRDMHHAQCPHCGQGCISVDHPTVCRTCGQAWPCEVQQGLDRIKVLEEALRRIENEMAHPSENPNRARRVALSFARRALSGDGPAGGETDRTPNLRIADEHARALAGEETKGG